MARPPKKTLDFFLHDSNARGDRKIKGLRRRHGNDGYATYFILLEMLCQEDGMRLSLSDSLDMETAIEDTGVRDQAHLHAIVQTCADIGLFDKQLWESERVVFSHGLHRRYKGRLEERRADAKRKQRKREEESLSRRIAEIEIQNPDPDPDPDPYTYPKHPELSGNCPGGKPSDNERGKTCKPELEPRELDPTQAGMDMAFFKLEVCPGGGNNWNLEFLKDWAGLWERSGRNPGDSHINLKTFIRKNMNPKAEKHEAMLDEFEAVKEIQARRAADRQVVEQRQQEQFEAPPTAVFEQLKQTLMGGSSNGAR